MIEDSFDSLLRLTENTSAVTVHGITRDESQKGVEEPEALEAFLGYLRDGVIVGHHIGHDIATFDAACTRHWGMRLLNRSLDTMDLTLHLERDGAFAGRPPIRRFTLDALCELFGVIPHDRHTASGDAFITAQVFLRLLRLAARTGRGTLAGVAEEFQVGEPGVTRSRLLRHSGRPPPCRTSHVNGWRASQRSADRSSMNVGTVPAGTIDAFQAGPRQLRNCS